MLESMVEPTDKDRPINTTHFVSLVSLRLTKLLCHLQYKMKLQKFGIYTHFFLLHMISVEKVSFCAAVCITNFFFLGCVSTHTCRTLTVTAPSTLL